MNFMKKIRLLKEYNNGQLNLSRDISTKITLTYRYHFHHLVSIIK